MKKVFLPLLLAALLPAWPAAAQESPWAKRLHNCVVKNEKRVRMERAEKTFRAATALGLKNYLQHTQNRHAPTRLNKEISALWLAYRTQKLTDVKPLLRALQRNQRAYARTEQITPSMLAQAARVLEDGKRAEDLNHIFPLNKYIVPIAKR